MADLSSFDITKRWPAQNPEVIQLYSLTTPNGVKASIMLEETGLDYELHKVSFATDDQLTPEFISLNPNNKIPAIIDPNGPGGNPVGVWESGAILIYLAEKAGMLLPTDPAKRIKVLQWLMFQMGGVGPMFGQFGHFYKFAADKVSDPYPTERYLNETKRLLGVLDKQLADREFVAGDYSIADIAIFPWLNVLNTFYEAGEVTEFESHSNVRAYADRCLARPAVERGMKIPA